MKLTRTLLLVALALASTGSVAGSVAFAGSSVEAFRPGWGPRPGPWRPVPGPRAFVCHARNLLGQTFQASGYDLRNVQFRAVQNCNRNSLVRSCVLVGCR